MTGAPTVAVTTDAENSQLKEKPRNRRLALLLPQSPLTLKNSQLKETKEPSTGAPTVAVTTDAEEF